MAEPIDDGPEEEFSGVFTDIFPAEWAADPDFCQYLTQLRNQSCKINCENCDNCEIANCDCEGIAISQITQFGFWGVIAISQITQFGFELILQL